jgi:tyrosyl-tRNA synthetase
MPVIDLLVQSELASSKGDARRAVQGGGIYVNNQRMSDVAQAVSSGEGRGLTIGRAMKHKKPPFRLEGGFLCSWRQAEF